MSSLTGQVTTENIFGQMLALQLGNGDEHPALESNTLNFPFHHHDLHRNVSLAQGTNTSVLSEVEEHRDK